MVVSIQPRPGFQTGYRFDKHTVGISQNLLDVHPGVTNAAITVLRFFLSGNVRASNESEDADSAEGYSIQARF